MWRVMLLFLWLFSGSVERPRRVYTVFCVCVTFASVRECEQVGVPALRGGSSTLARFPQVGEMGGQAVAVRACTVREGERVAVAVAVAWHALVGDFFAPLRFNPPPRQTDFVHTAHVCWSVSFFGCYGTCSPLRESLVVLRPLSCRACLCL